MTETSGIEHAARLRVLGERIDVRAGPPDARSGSSPRSGRGRVALPGVDPALVEADGLREVARDEIADRVAVEGGRDLAAHRHHALELARPLGDLRVQGPRRALGDPLGLAPGLALAFEARP